MNNNTQIQLALNLEQAKTLEHILDCYVQLSLGNQAALKDMPIPNERLGIGSRKQAESGKIAHDIDAVLRCCLADFIGASNISPWRDPPIKYSQQPLPQCQTKLSIYNAVTDMKPVLHELIATVKCLESKLNDVTKSNRQLEAEARKKANNGIKSEHGARHHRPECECQVCYPPIN